MNRMHLALLECAQQKDVARALDFWWKKFAVSMSHEWRQTRIELQYLQNNAFDPTYLEHHKRVAVVEMYERLKPAIEERIENNYNGSGARRTVFTLTVLCDGEARG